MTTRYLRGPIEPRWGYFYGLSLNRDSSDFDAAPVKGKIANVTPRDQKIGLVMYIPEYKRVYYETCCELASWGVSRAVFEYRTGREIATVAWMEMGLELVCKKELAFAFLSSGLVGVSVARAEVYGDSDHISDEWYHVIGHGRDCIMQGHCEPSPYKCWNCGAEPICPVCHRRPASCPKCDAEYIVSEEDANLRNEKRLVIVDDPEHPYPAIDLARWDGSDYFCGEMTHRMVQFLLKMKAHPFRAIPLPVNVHGASQADLERLEQARAPLQT